MSTPVDQPQAMFSARSLARLPVAAQAVILYALSGVAGMRDVRGMLAQRLLLFIGQQVNSSSLREIFIVLHALATHDTKLVTGKLLAAVVQRLLKAEVTVGGPYIETSGRIDIVTNTYIHVCMQRLGKELPCVKEFLAQQPRMHSASTIAISALTKNEKVDLLAIPAVISAFILTAQAKCRYDINLKNDYQCQNTQVVACARAIACEFAGPTQKQVLHMVDNFTQKDKHREVALLSLFFQDALTGCVQAPRLWVRLGAANLFYWLAYLIYDDFIDDNYQPHKLSVANICMRRSLRLYQQSIPQGLPSNLVTQVFDDMDAANAWEVIHCRANISNGRITIGQLPAYGHRHCLGRRAFGHVLGPLIIAMRAGIANRHMRLLECAWTHFLIARQLNDDIHDWKVDLEKGHISFIVADMLSNMAVEPGTYKTEELMKSMQEHFWQCGLIRSAQLIGWHISQAKLYFHKTPGLVLGGELLSLCNQIELSANAALVRHENEKQFIAAYRAKH